LTLNKKNAKVKIPESIRGEKGVKKIVEFESRFIMKFTRSLDEFGKKSA